MSNPLSGVCEVVGHVWDDDRCTVCLVERGGTVDGFWDEPAGIDVGYVDPEDHDDFEEARDDARAERADQRIDAERDERERSAPVRPHATYWRRLGR